MLTMEAEGEIHRVDPDFGSTFTASNRDSQSNCWFNLKSWVNPVNFRFCMVALQVDSASPSPSGRARSPARAGNRRFWLLSTLRAHTKVPYKIDLHRKTLIALNRPWEGADGAERERGGVHRGRVEADRALGALPAAGLGGGAG
jgi:hypothetical protein